MSLLSFKESENEKLDGVWLIERLWIDHLENHNAYGYEAIGFVSSEERARQICISSYIPTSYYPWPLEVSFGKNKEVSEYRATYLPCLDAIDHERDKIKRCRPMEMPLLLSKDDRIKKINERNKEFWDLAVRETVDEIRKGFLKG